MRRHSPLVLAVVVVVVVVIVVVVAVVVVSVGPKNNNTSVRVAMFQGPTLLVINATHSIFSSESCNIASAVFLIGQRYLNGDIIVAVCIFR